MSRFSLVVLLAGAAGCCYLPTFEAADGGSTRGSGTSSGGSTGSTGGGSSGGSGGLCQVPVAGSCATDADCVVAFCADWSCNCGGTAIARSQLDENACLIEEGAAVPPVCLAERTGPECDCPAFAVCTAECSAGACACAFSCPNGETACDRLCVNTAVDSDNCGSCGNVCDPGRSCADGVCSSSGGSSGGSTGSGGGSSSGGTVGGSSGACTDDSQCAGDAGGYCDFTTEPCGEPPGGSMIVPGSCLAAAATGQSCVSNADCGPQDFCALPNCTGATNCVGTCTEVTCGEPPQACTAGCAVETIPHGCGACLCLTCCLECA